MRTVIEEVTRTDLLKWKCRLCSAAIVMLTLIFAFPMPGQTQVGRQGKSKSRPEIRSSVNGQSRQRRSDERLQSYRSRKTAKSRLRKTSVADYRGTFYKANAQKTVEPEAFATSGFAWPAPDDPSENYTITYSYSNLLDDGVIQGLTSAQIRAATEEALSLWASVAGIDFVEIEDSGPNPTQSDNSYAVGDAADIRIGAHLIDGAPGGILAHAFLPYSTTDGIAGDLHFDAGEDWGENDGGVFLEVMLHELGHTLGLEHEEINDAIMNAFLANRFAAIGEGYLLEDDELGIQDIYGQGSGSVTPLAVDEEPEEPEEGPAGEDPPQDGPDEPQDGPEDDPEGGDPAAGSNNVTTELNVDTNDLDITGDESSNNVLVFQFRWLTIVMGLRGTTVNGNAGAFYFGDGQETFSLNMLGGSDSVISYGVRSSLLCVDLGDGEDYFAAVFNRLGQLKIDGGPDNDTVRIMLSRIGESVVAGLDDNGDTEPAVADGDAEEGEAEKGDGSAISSQRRNSRRQRNRRQRNNRRRR